MRALLRLVVGINHNSCNSWHCELGVLSSLFPSPDFPFTYFVEVCHISVLRSYVFFECPEALVVAAFNPCLQLGVFLFILCFHSGTKTWEKRLV